ncbi:hypothetical protein N7462_003313 [Penicillium macrosclerotiorum]|uniref:uncharacterized protein n=1 Tax=Penicillium macrosclerotiorum TaxID=303699 RepID=UPI002547A15F|nr:uncharacterized protein N7462_003313 [Penicillium macrosclerotiorum]KAJ5688921.1 hypothetical protein N7462_003313 [Penicillium macrosclerotiorum]
MSDLPQAPVASQEERPDSSPEGSSQTGAAETEEARTETRDHKHESRESQEQEEKAQKEGGEERQPEDDDERTAATAPPLPDEVPPPLPDEAPPGPSEDDGWEPVWDGNAQAYYFYNRFTKMSQWENPRVPDASATAPGTDGDARNQETPQKKEPVLGGYNPAIHGDYDPTAPYAQQYEEQAPDADASADPAAAYSASGAFNRFTGRWQAESINPENYNDENKSRRQMNAFFDVDAAANSHDGRSLRAERSAKKLSKKELKMFKEKRREKKEEKRRAWLRD